MVVDLEINSIQFQLEVETWKATRGYRNSMGVPEEPDEDAGYAIEKIMIPQQKAFDLMEMPDPEEIERKLLEWFESQEYDEAI